MIRTITLAAPCRAGAGAGSEDFIAHRRLAAANDVTEAQDVDAGVKNGSSGLVGFSLQSTGLCHGHMPVQHGAALALTEKSKSRRQSADPAVRRALAQSAARCNHGRSAEARAAAQGATVAMR